MVPGLLRTKPAIFGGLLAVGTFESAALVVGFVLIAWAASTAIQNRRIPLWGVILWAAFASPFRPIESTITAGLVLALAVLADDIRRDWSLNDFVTGLVVGSAIQVTAAVYTWGEYRPGLYSQNASVLAQTGLMFWLILPELLPRNRFVPWAWAAVHLGVSVSRSPLLAAAVLVGTRPNKRMIIAFAGILAVWIFAASSQGALDRVMPAQVRQATETRAAIVEAAVTTPVLVPANIRVDAIPEGDGIGPKFIPGVRTISLGGNRMPLTGYGVGQYINETGLVRPHNVAILLFFEMGYLVLIPAGLFAWVVWTRRIPLSVALSLLVLWQFVEEPAARFEGFFTTTAVFVAVYRHPARELFPPALRPPRWLAGPAIGLLGRLPGPGAR